MKRLFSLLVVPILFLAGHAFADPDLEGCWLVEQVCVGDFPPAPVAGIEVEFINQTPEGLFEVINCSDPGSNPCYGAIDGKDVYITCWDNIITGELMNKSKKHMKLGYVSQIQTPIPPDDGVAATCKGTATKLGDCSVACP